MNILKSLFSFGARSQPAEGKNAQANLLNATAPVVPPVNLDIPVTNPSLVDAIQKHQRVQSNDSLAELFSELMKSVLLAGLILEAPPTRTSATQVVFQKGDKMGFIEVRDNSERRLLALFTDHPEMQHFTDQANSSLVMPIEQALNFVLEKNYDGMVINPAGSATLRLDAPFIRTLKKDV